MAQSTERERLLAKLESIATVGYAEREALFGLKINPAEYDARSDIVAQGETPTHACLVVSGLVYRYRLLRGGARQIISFHVPGDIPDLMSLHLGVMDHSLGALSRAQVAFIPHGDIRSLLSAHPTLAFTFWRDTLIDAAMFREWIVGLGRRSAKQRVAHLLCEMAARFQAVGLLQEGSYGFPVTQAELGDALGLSTVHVNRVLRELRGILSLQRSRVFADWSRLKAIAEFDPTYLHLEPGFGI